MYAIIAFIPIIVTVIVMAGLNWPAKIALPLAWLITAVIGFAVWQMDLVAVAAQTITGFLSSFDTIIIIFGAILIMNSMKHSGAMRVINRMFTNVSDDPRIQMVIIGFMFGGSSKEPPVLAPPRHSPDLFSSAWGFRRCALRWWRSSSTQRRWPLERSAPRSRRRLTS